MLVNAMKIIIVMALTYYRPPRTFQ